MTNKGMKFLVVLAILLLSGCATNYPKTADEYRQTAPNGFLTEKIEAPISQPVDVVGRIFEQKVDECLNVTITSTHIARGTDYYYEKERYKYLIAKVDVRSDAVELVIWEKFGEGWAPVGMPEDGYIYFVVDVTPDGNTSSNLVMYRPKIMYKALAQSIIDWANGKAQGCPDLSG